MFIILIYFLDETTCFAVDAWSNVGGSIEII